MLEAASRTSAARAPPVRPGRSSSWPSCGGGRAARDAARTLLDRAGASPAVQLCRARLALDAGASTRAIELLEVARRAGPGPQLGAGARAARPGARRSLPPELARRRRPSPSCAGLWRCVGTPAAARVGRRRRGLARSGRWGARARAEAARGGGRRLRELRRALRGRGGSGRACGNARRARPRRPRARSEVAAAEAGLRAGSAPAGLRGCRDAPRAGRARLARRRAHEPADRRAARPQRAHGPSARDQHPAQARPALPRGCRRVRGPVRHLTAKMASSGDAVAGRQA